MTAPVTAEYAGAADAHTAPLIDQEYFRKNNETKHGEEHDNQHERHIGALLENASVRPAPAGTGSSTRAHAREETLQMTIILKSYSYRNQIQYLTFCKLCKTKYVKYIIKLRIMKNCKNASNLEKERKTRKMIVIKTRQKNFVHVSLKM